MWAWYKEWGAIARVAIADRRLLRGLGYLSPKKASRGEDEVDDSSAEPAEVVVTDEVPAGSNVSLLRALPAQASVQNRGVTTAE